MTVAETIRKRLSILTPESVEIVDESGQHAGHTGAREGGGHYQLIIVSSQFRNIDRQARHRMVYTALAPMMRKDIHALAIKAYAPDEL